MQLTLLNNTINVTTLPSKFDLRDWGWVSPVRDQGWMGSCWTFGITGTLESALLKNAGITTDFSENNMQNTMIKYSIYGSAEAAEGGLSDKIETLLPRTLRRTVRVPFSTYGSNRPLSKSIRQHNLSIFKVFRFITIKRRIIMFNHYMPFVNVSPPHFN